MVPVRSEPTQPVLPSVSPIRLLPWEATVPKASGPLVLAVFPATMVLPSVTVLPDVMSRPPPLSPQELPLMVQSVNVSTLLELPLKMPPPPVKQVLPVMVQPTRVTGLALT